MGILKVVERKTVVMNKLQSWYYCMEIKYRMQIVQKSSSTLMKIIATVLNIVHKVVPNVCSGKEFLEDFTMTLYDTIYACYDLDKLKEEDAKDDIPHIIHETQHVLQYRKNKIIMPLKYLMSNYWRMYYEVEAISGELEYKVKINSPEDLLADIDNSVYCLRTYYGISPKNAKLAKEMLLKNLEKFKAGKFRKNTIADYAISFWSSLEKR